MEQQAAPALLAITLPDYDRELQYEIRRELKSLVITPRFDFHEEQARYVLCNLLSSNRLTRPRREAGQSLLPSTSMEREEVVASFLDRLARHSPFRTAGPGSCTEEFAINAIVIQRTSRQKRNSPVPHYSEDVAPVVFEALRVFGYNAVRLTPADALIVRSYPEIPSYGFLCALDRLGSVIGEIVRDWQARVREKTNIEKRRHIAKYLHKFGKLLVPSTVGKRKTRVTVRGDEIVKYYYESLFACEQASALLKAMAKVAGQGRWEMRLAAICTALHLPSDYSWWGFNDQAQVLRQLRIPKESAILLTARQYRPTTEQTIRNILSR